MYRKKAQSSQHEFVDFYLRFGGELDPKNRWIQLTRLIPWEAYEKSYAGLFPSKRGALAKPFRMALGALLIKNMKRITDEEVVQELKENPYLQYLVGLEKYQSEAPFDASMMVHYRKRISVEMLLEINEKIVKSQLEREEKAKKKRKNKRGSSGGDDGNEEGSGTKVENKSSDEKQDDVPKKGHLLVDATCVPADIRYPTDVSILNEAREKSEEIIDVLYELMKGKIKKPRTYRQNARKDFLQVARSWKPSKKVIRKGIGKQLHYLKRNLGYIGELIKHTPLSVLSKQQYKNLLVIHEMYRQQLEMYEERKHKIPGRIVSVSQPHVRPIVRGKARASVEFGAKISVAKIDGYAFLETMSWEPYHEGNKLKEHIEVYNQRFGYYPETVLADKIYRTRANLKYCKGLGIRLGGPPLGRPPKDKEKHKALLRASREDERLRIPIEGVFGVAKRRYGMDVIREKLSVTSENTLAMVILGLNLNKILRNLFVLLYRYVRWVIFRLVFRWKLAEIM